ncbi:MAG: YgiT-type zinc finger protein [Anaerolineae bacterium]|jgi:YgiT-type zinc finger domain-containing protein|nr:YgiT-type zinc finger protein [Anaerolineae bacterium]
MNDCLICKGHLDEQHITRLQQYQGRWFIIENVPALVCSQCGEVYYTPDAHDHVIDLLTSQTSPVRFETVAVLDATA